MSLNEPVPVHIPPEIERQGRYVVHRCQTGAAVIAVPVGFADVERVLDRDRRCGGQYSPHRCRGHRGHPGGVAAATTDPGPVSPPPSEARNAAYRALLSEESVVFAAAALAGAGSQAGRALRMNLNPSMEYRGQRLKRVAGEDTGRDEDTTDPKRNRAAGRRLRRPYLCDLSKKREPSVPIAHRTRAVGRTVEQSCSRPVQILPGKRPGYDEGKNHQDYRDECERGKPDEEGTDDASKTHGTG